MSNNKTKEIVYLKKLIRYGEKIDIDTLKYKRELKRIDKTIVVHKPIQTKFVLKPQYTIKSIKQDKNSVIIDFNKNVDKSYLTFLESKGKNKFIDTFEIKGSFKYANSKKLNFSAIDKTLVIQKRKNLLKISFTNKTNPQTIYILNKKQIIIKVLNVVKSKKRIKNIKKVKKVKKVKTIKEKVKILPNNLWSPAKKTIVIDAGHGGRDAGAVGFKRIYEKNIALKVSKYVKDELRKKGFRVYLTRSKDKYVKLSYRTKYANKKKADMFISIHANAARKARANAAHGVETYFLSPARSERAKKVAALENRGDMNSMGWSSKNSLLTILNQGKITASNKMAIDIQKNMLYALRLKYGKKYIRDGGVREGPFWVLVGAQMPSVLVEVGYISHPKEGRRINTTTYQKRIAKGIAKGIESYFSKN